MVASDSFRFSLSTATCCSNRERKMLTQALAADTPGELLDILERVSRVEAVRKDRNNIRFLVPLLRPLYPESKTRREMMTPADLAGTP